ncbi:tetratricopeptide repeat protein [Salibacterium halotolerans]|uniref:tetratricopeptide repeat protein n=1 Tax=Salibacterium halotolerans TaxID=1884432 RepID=UPI0014811B9C|nr:tetratricopeptide repeat protein [Salibacterium halotolerans]
MKYSLEQIMEIIQQGNTEKGLELLNEFEKEADHQQQYDLVQLYNELGRPDKAEPLVQYLIQNYPDEGELLTTAAETAIDMDKEDEAIEWLLEVDKKDEAFLQAQMLLADLYQLQGLDEVAESKLKAALQEAPEEPVLLAGLGDYYLEQGDFSKSIPYLKQAERQGFEFPEGSLDLRLAEAYSSTGNFEDAMSYYEKGIKEKQEPQALFGYGYTALQVSDYQTASKQLEELKAMDPEFVTLYPYLVRAYEGVEHFDQALKTAEDGLSVDEFNDQLFLEAGKLHMALDDQSSSEKRLREALSLNPANRDAAFAVLELWHTQEDYESMIDLVSYLKDIKEDDPGLDWYLGKAQWGEEDFNKALETYKGIQQEYTENELFLEDYGRLLLELGYREQALRHFRSVLSIDPANTEIQELVTDLEDSGM